MVLRRSEKLQEGAEQLRGKLLANAHLPACHGLLHEAGPLTQKVVAMMNSHAGGLSEEQLTQCAGMSRQAVSDRQAW